jgi:hypothetical protein
VVWDNPIPTLDLAPVRLRNPVFSDPCISTFEELLFVKIDQTYDNSTKRVCENTWHIRFDLPIKISANQFFSVQSPLSLPTLMKDLQI